MDNITNHLLVMADDLDKIGKIEAATSIDNLVKTASLNKLAQYVGAIGYVLKQNRAMNNCVRRKRSSSDKPMQEIIFDCLHEYQDGQSYQDEEWTTKYAAVVKQTPDNYDNAHLYFLRSLAEVNDIGHHLNNVRKTATVLKQNDINDDMINDILLLAEECGKFLQKEAQARPFDSAAPRTRNWWSRLTKPTSFSGTNPFSWSWKRRGRGQDEETIIEMEKILQDIMNITTISQKIRTTISRLKNQVRNYMAGSVSPEHDQINQPYSGEKNQNTINAIVNKIDGLSHTDWDETIKNTHQLQWLLNKSKPLANAYNVKHITLAQKLSNDLIQQSDIIYDLLDSIQTNMNSLRQRPAITGREFGLKNNNETNPASKFSTYATEEFGVLEQVLEKLSQNPFDYKAHFYAQKAHSRLNDILHYISREKDTDLNEWIQNEEQEQPISNQPAQTVNNATPVSDSTIDQISQQLASTVSSGGQLQQLIDLISKISTAAMTPSANTPTEIKQFLMQLLEKLQSNISSVSNVNNATTPTVKPSANTPSVSNQIEEDDSEVLDFLKSSNSNESWLIKVADILDTVDLSIGDLIDDYIQEETKNSIKNYPEQPNVATIIKEKIK